MHHRPKLLGGLVSTAAISIGHNRPRPRVSVVIPTLNEARNIAHVLAKMPDIVDEIVLVDGHSIDGTVEVARSVWPDIVVVNQNRRGKGNALACGFAASTGDVIVMIDADCSTDPFEIPSFVSALVAGADYAKGSRFCAGGGSGDITRIRRFGNRVLNGIVNVLFRTAFSDLCYGYNAFWRHALESMCLNTSPHLAEPQWGDGFEIETMINVRVARAGLRISEVPSFERPRLHGDSNLNAIRDGMRVLRTVVNERLRAAPVRSNVIALPDTWAARYGVADLRPDAWAEGVVMSEDR